MTTILAKSSLMLLVLFAGLVGAIRAQPYDDGQLRAFLTAPQDCPMPCFMGIRPGVTTLEEAVMILATHDWVAEVKIFYNRFGRMNQAQWTWSGLQPTFIDATTQAYMVAPEGIVEIISAQTVIPFGSLVLVLGEPDRGATEVSARGTRIIFNNAGYMSSSLGVRSLMRCPARLWNLFETTVSISFIADVEARYGSSDYRFVGWSGVQPCA